jgi:hypothetical protein
MSKHKERKDIPDVIKHYHLNHLRNYHLNSGVLLERLMALPMVANYVLADDAYNDNSNGLTQPSSPTTPLV